MIKGHPRGFLRGCPFLSTEFPVKVEKIPIFYDKKDYH